MADKNAEYRPAQQATKPCPWGGLGLVGDLSGLPTDRAFEARCSCGAHVTVVDGRIPFHRFGVNESPPDEPCEGLAPGEWEDSDGE